MARYTVTDNAGVTRKMKRDEYRIKNWESIGFFAKAETIVMGACKAVFALMFLVAIVAVVGSMIWSAIF